MVASNETCRSAVEVVLRHLPPSAAVALLDELRGVPGNASFTQTLGRIAGELERTSPPIGEPAASPTNDVVEFYGTTDLDRLGELYLRGPGGGADAEAQAGALARANPGNVIYLSRVVAAFLKPRDRDYLLRLPVRGRP